MHVLIYKHEPFGRGRQLPVQQCHLRTRISVPEVRQQQAEYTRAAHAYSTTNTNLAQLLRD